MYQTHAYPEFGPLSPSVERDDDAPEFAVQTARTLKDIFGEYQDLHQPEYDAPSYAKSKAVFAALALAYKKDATVESPPTLGETAEMVGIRDLAEERDVADYTVTPEVLAVTAYAETVRSLDWGVDDLGGEWHPNALVLVHDPLREMKEIGREMYRTPDCQECGPTTWAKQGDHDVYLCDECGFRPRKETRDKIEEVLGR